MTSFESERLSTPSGSKEKAENKAALNASPAKPICEIDPKVVKNEEAKKISFAFKGSVSEKQPANPFLAPTQPDSNIQPLIGIELKSTIK